MRILFKFFYRHTFLKKPKITLNRVLQQTAIKLDVYFNWMKSQLVNKSLWEEGLL